MNTNHLDSILDSTAPFNPAESLSRSRLRQACDEATDYLTPLLSAFLVVCMLTALTLCGWAVTESGSAQARPDASTVAVEKLCVDAQHVF